MNDKRTTGCRNGKTQCKNYKRGNTGRNRRKAISENYKKIQEVIKRNRGAGKVRCSERILKREDKK